METKDLRNIIIQKVLHTDDNQLLNFLYEILNNNEPPEIYHLSDFEKKHISESLADYEAAM